MNINFSCYCQCVSINSIDADTFYTIAPFNSVTTSFLLLDVTFMNLPYFSDSENTKQKWNRQEEYIFIVKPF